MGATDATHRHSQIIECSCFFAARKARWDKNEQLERTSVRVQSRAQSSFQMRSTHTHKDCQIDVSQPPF